MPTSTHRKRKNAPFITTHRSRLLCSVFFNRIIHDRLIFISVQITVFQSSKMLQCVNEVVTVCLPAISSCVCVCVSLGFYRMLTLPHLHTPINVRAPPHAKQHTPTHV